jgi:hypothetical protein
MARSQRHPRLVSQQADVRHHSRAEFKAFRSRVIELPIRRTHSHANDAHTRRQVKRARIPAFRALAEHLESLAAAVELNPQRRFAVDRHGQVDAPEVVPNVEVQMRESRCGVRRSTGV